MSTDGMREWMETALRDMVRSAPENRLNIFGARTIFDDPIVGVADGDDAVFARFRQAVGERHLMPREFLRAAVGRRTEPDRVSVVSWALPFTEPVRRSNRGGDGPSPLYSIARNNGGALGFDVCRRFVERFKDLGAVAAAPALNEAYDTFRSADHGFSSTWSERHVGYAAGLGRFGLSAGLITARGVCVRFGSVVTDLPLPADARGADHRAQCLRDGGASCGACIGRCPVGAVTANGHDKAPCFEMRRRVREQNMDALVAARRLRKAPIVTHGIRREGYSLGCALCQCGVPCEDRNPFEDDHA